MEQRIRRGLDEFFNGQFGIFNEMFGGTMDSNTKLNAENILIGLLTTYIQQYDGISTILKYMILAKKYQLNSLKNFGENHLISRQEENITADRRLCILKIANDFGLTRLKDSIDGYLCVQDLRNPWILYQCLSVVVNCNGFPRITEIVSPHIDQLLIDYSLNKKFPSMETSDPILTSHLKRYISAMFIIDLNKITRSEVRLRLVLQLSDQYNLTNLKNEISIYLANEFENNTSLKLMYLAVKYDLEEFKVSIENYLRRITSAELTEEEKQIIVNASSSVMDFVFLIFCDN